MLLLFDVLDFRYSVFGFFLGLHFSPGHVILQTALCWDMSMDENERQKRSSKTHLDTLREKELLESHLVCSYFETQTGNFYIKKKNEINLQ